MTDSNDRTEQAAEAKTETDREDARKPYEAPRLVKKRSIARATLLTAHGPSVSGLAGMG